ncbi:MAG: Z1 domain-containing protein [Gemmatimonadota bacterium]
MASGDNEHIEVVSDQGEGSAQWSPVEGEQASQLLLRKLPDQSESRLAVLSAAQEILSHCVPPDRTSGEHTELVVGYVQSGKTLSFTTVASLANDNQFRMIIVIAGTTNDLAEQTRDRFLQDLGLDETPFTRWQHFHEPGHGERDTIRDVLADWDDPNIRPDERRTVLITVKKNHTRLRHLTQLLQQLGPLAHAPTLIIDDEADQASLNNLVREGDLSTTYARLLQLKQSLAHHSFIQYTATPQANLLINLIDVLSPQRVVVLDAGADYVGGATFFANNSPYLRLIPPNEIPDRDHPFDDPPDTLCEAMRLFFVGVASGLHRRDGRPRHRSMMVHPSRLIAGHTQYHNWIQAIRSTWIDILSGNAGEEDRAALLGDFQSAHASLASTTPGLEDFSVLEPRLVNSIRSTQVRALNSDADMRRIRWNSNYSWILVGGAVLDRGFTIEGLTVTYMPRGPGVGNADTIQQRARFLGYKRPYLGFCRVFLEPAVANAYRAYVEHEEDVRARLTTHIATGRPLREFRRMFICDRSLRPTRQSVLDIDYDRPTFRSGWYAPNRPLLTTASVERNRGLIASFLGRSDVTLVPDNGLTTTQQHHIARAVPLQLAYEELLASFELGDIEEDHKWIVALLLIDRYLAAHPEATCSLYHMSGGAERRRGVENGRILNLFQGANPSTGPTQGSVYPGDRNMIGSEPVTVQIHNVTFVDGHVATGTELINQSPLITLWMNEEVRRDVVVQNQR